MSAPRAPGLAFLLGTLLAAQTFGTLATMTLPAVAPKVAETHGISASLIGYQISLLAAFMLVSLTLGSRLSVRWGACRATQVALALLIAGCLTAILPHAAFVFASSIALGLGYGLLSPPASQLLARFTPFTGIAIVWRHRVLRLLSISGGSFVVVQVCLQTFTVVLFVEQIGIGLVTAGIVLMASQVGGVFGRLFWGWIADVMRSCFGALAVLAGVMMATCLLVLALGPDWPLAASCALFFVLGSTASGWNGAFMAEVARLSPRKEISTATAGALVFVNFGKMVGPIAFTSLYLLTGSYTLLFGLLALPAAVGFACAVAAHHASARALAGVKT